MAEEESQQRFDALLREHQKIVFKVANIYARTLEDRRNLEQEILIQLWRSFSRYDGSRGKFSMWMYRIALNVATLQLRRGKNLDHAHETLEGHMDTMAGGDSIAEPDARLAALYGFIGGLDPLNRALILLHLEDRNYAEIADVLGISETNVATKISRIRQKFREKFMHATIDTGE